MKSVCGVFFAGLVAFALTLSAEANVAALRARATASSQRIHHWTFEGNLPLSDGVGSNHLKQVVIGKGYGDNKVAFRKGGDDSTQAMYVAYHPSSRDHGASLITQDPLDLESRPVTIEFLFKPEPVRTSRYWYVLGFKGSRRGYIAYLPKPGEGKVLATYIGNSGEQELVSDLKTGVWYYYAINLNNGSAVCDVYIGEASGEPILRKVAVNMGDRETFPKKSPLAIGGLAINGSLRHVWRGAVDEVTVYGGHLSDKEIATHFAALLAKPGGEPPEVEIRTRVIAPPVDPNAPPAEPEVKEVKTRAFFDYVKRYADAMIEKSRRNLPEPATPLFPITLNRETYRLPEGRVGALITARVPQQFSAIANPQHDMNLYQVLYALTRFTGDTKYADEADKVIAYFLKHCAEPRYGFFCWGEHLGWDLRKHAPGGFPADNAPNTAIHEFYRPWIFWDKSFEVAPEACLRYARAIWRHQINHEGGLSFSRHAMVMKGDDPSRRGYEFPRHGGFYISTLAAAYAHTQGKEFLGAVEQLVAFYESRRHPKTGAIPHGTTDVELDREGNASEIFYSPSPLTLGIELHDSADKMPADLGKRMLDLAAGTDKVFLELPHDPGPGGKGFVVFARPDDLEPREFWVKKEDIEQGRPPRRIPYTGGWRMGYVGQYPHSWLASGLIRRYEQTKHQGYRRHVLACADNYLRASPGRDDDVTAGAIGNVILLLNAAFEMSGEEKYLERAEWFGRFAITCFWPDELPLPLPSRSARENVYAASSRCDTLAMAMLETWQLRTRSRQKAELLPTDR